MTSKLFVNSKDKSKYYVVDLVEKKCYVVSRASCNIVKYEDDAVNLCNSIGTLAFINKQYNVYGILRERRSGVGIIWVKAEDAKKDEKFNYLANLHGELFDITEFGIDAFNTNWYPKLEKSILARNLKGTLINKENFLENIGYIQLDKEDATITNKEDNSLEEESNTYKSIEESSLVEEDTITNEKENNMKEKHSTYSMTDATIMEYLRSIEDRLVEVVKREELLAKKEEDLAIKSSKLNKLFAEYDGLVLNSLNEEVIDVDLAVDNGEIQEVKASKPDYVYELLLKMLSKNDSITIPKSYYSSLKILPKKQLEVNLSYTKYKSISTLKFRGTDKDNIICIVDFDESNPNVKITVLKEFGNNTLEDNEIRDYLNQYALWRKQTFTIQ